MTSYHIFGGCLQSELDFPELAVAPDEPPTWQLRLGELEPWTEEEVLAEVAPTPTCWTRVTRHGQVVRYTHSCSGTFEIRDARTIIYAPAPTGRPDIARTDFVSRVLLQCVDQSAVTWIHGSAVEISGAAIGFLGPSGAGKSTLALALARAGARHICDDTLPVDASVLPCVWPSDHTLRLRPDSRAMLAQVEPAVRRESDGKYVLTHDALPAGSVTSGADGAPRTPLTALYLLRPDVPFRPAHSGGPVAVRRRIAPTAALPLLLQHVKHSPVLAPGTPIRLLERFGALANAVEIYELFTARDWAVLDEVTATILGWHSARAVADRAPVSGAA